MTMVEVVVVTIGDCDKDDSQFRNLANSGIDLISLDIINLCPEHLTSSDWYITWSTMSKISIDCKP